MKNQSKLLGGLAVLAALALFFGPYLFQQWFPYQSMGMGRAFGRMPMMGYSGFNFLSFGGFVLMFLPILFLALAAVGAVWLVNNRGGSKPVPATPVAAIRATCPGCGEPVQDGWKHCPQCAYEL
jgi:hypothetical protein